MAVERDVRQAALEAVLRVGAWVTSSPSSSMVPAAWCSRPRMASHSSNWPLPSTPAMPSDLAGADLERDVVDGRSRADAASTVMPDDAQSHGRRRSRWSRPCGEGSSLPTISSASFARLTSPGFTSATVVPAADDGDVVGDRQHLVELVRDEDDGGTVVDELAEVGEQLVDLLRHEHGGRLVEDEDASAAVQHLQDLDPLALADAELGHRGVEVDVRARTDFMISCELLRGRRRSG